MLRVSSRPMIAKEGAACRSRPKNACRRKILLKEQVRKKIDMETETTIPHAGRKRSGLNIGIRVVSKIVPHRESLKKDEPKWENANSRKEEETQKASMRNSK